MHVLEISKLFLKFDMNEIMCFNFVNNPWLMIKIFFLLYIKLFYFYANCLKVLLRFFNPLYISCSLYAGLYNCTYFMILCGINIYEWYCYNNIIISISNIINFEYLYLSFVYRRVTTANQSNLSTKYMLTFTFYHIAAPF